MEFQNKDPKQGDIIRVVIRDNYHHYGIYIGDDRVIEFGSKSDVLKSLAKDIKVKEVSVKEFLEGGHLEVSVFSLMDKLKKNNPKKIVELAKKRIGEDGYDLINNNCEHFCYEVVFNRHYSSMSDEHKNN